MGVSVAFVTVATEKHTGDQRYPPLLAGSGDEEVGLMSEALYSWCMWLPLAWTLRDLL